MRPFEIVSLILSIRQLSKQNEEWGRVYRRYLFCLLLVVIITVIRCVTNLVLLGFILFLIYALFIHPPIANAIVTSANYRWVDLIVQSFHIFERSDVHV